MAEIKKTTGNNVFSENDPLDINELASLDGEITPEFIASLQNKIAGEDGAQNDGELFEEPVQEEAEEKVESKAEPADEATAGTTEKETDEEKGSVGFNDELDDNFIKKYKAKLKKHNSADETDEYSLPARSEAQTTTEESEPVKAPADKDDIEKISGGNITEKPITNDYMEYKDSLDYVDGNVKYSKYVVYIDPENKDFMDSLTVKERKNLINRIIREQDSITITKRRLNKMHVILIHAIVAILTIVIAIPCIYWAINASLEATINNYHSSQNAFEQLYKEYGKIKK